MSDRPYRRDLPEGIRHGTRGEPTGRDLPTELELNEAAERARRDREATERERRPRWWQRVVAGRVFKR